jgi:hypothetical protein
MARTMTAPYLLRRRAMRTIIFVLATFGIGCVESHDTWDPSDAVTIANGIYGQTIAACPEVGTPCTVQAEPNISVGAYEGVELPDPSSDAPAKTTLSDERGFFQLLLPEGTYRLCRGDQIDGLFVPSSCTAAAAWVSDVVRIDLF